MSFLHSRCILILLTILLSDFAHTIENVVGKQINKIIAGEGEEIVVSPNKIGPGTWRIRSYDPNAIELLEDIKKPFPSFIFNALKPSDTVLELGYKDNNNIEKKIYKIVILKNKNSNNKGNNSFPAKTKKNRSSFAAKENISKNQEKYYGYISKLYELKLYEEAISSIEEFEVLFNNSRKMKDVRLIKANALINIGMNDEAIKVYENIIIQNIPTERKVKILFFLAELYKKNANYKKLKNTLTNIITLSESSADSSKAYFELGKVYFLTKEHRIAVKQFEIIINNFPEERKIREKSLYLLASAHYKKTKLQNYHLSYKYLKILKAEFPHGGYHRKAIDKMKYIKANFIDFF